MNKTSRVFLILWLAIALGIALFITVTLIHINSRPLIRVVNSSQMDIHDVVVIGRGFEVNYPVVHSGDKLKFKASVLGESAISIKFLAGTQVFEKLNMGYIETRGGYRSTLTINEDLDVEYKPK